MVDIPSERLPVNAGDSIEIYAPAHVVWQDGTIGEMPVDLLDFAVDLYNDKSFERLTNVEIGKATADQLLKLPAPGPAQVYLRIEIPGGSDKAAHYMSSNQYRLRCWPKTDADDIATLLIFLVDRT